MERRTFLAIGMSSIFSVPLLASDGWELLVDRRYGSDRYGTVAVDGIDCLKIRRAWRKDGKLKVEWRDCHCYECRETGQCGVIGQRSDKPFAACERDHSGTIKTSIFDRWVIYKDENPNTLVGKTIDVNGERVSTREYFQLMLQGASSYDEYIRRCHSAFDSKSIFYLVPVGWKYCP